MKQLLRACVGALVLAAHASAGEVAYRFKVGTSMRFDARMLETTSFRGLGMNTRSVYETHTTFELRIAKVKADGTAVGTLLVEALDVKAAGGRRVATLEAIPKRALETNVEVDRKGAFRFKDLAYLVVDDDKPAQIITMSADAAHAGLAATVQRGEQEVTVYASFDAKTGNLEGGVAGKAFAPKRSTIAVEQDLQKIEVLPQQLLELVRLPDGALRAGASSTTTTTREPGRSQLVITVRADELTAERAHLTTVVATAPDAGESDDPMTASASGGTIADVELGATGGATMPAKAAVPGGAAPLGRNVSGTMTSAFSVAEGMFSDVDGRITSAMSLGAAMSVTTARTIALKRLGQ